MPGAVLPAGWLSTSGNQIVEAATGNPVRIASINWRREFGSISGDAAKIRALGFNCIRASWVNLTRDGDLARLDQIVTAAKANNLKVIIDNHTNEPGRSQLDGFGEQQRNGLWFDSGTGSDGTDGGGNTGTTTAAKFLSDWQVVATHFQTEQAVIGFDLRHEPFNTGAAGSEWATATAKDIKAMYETVGNAISAINPNVLLICEGVQRWGGGVATSAPCPWGDLSVVHANPINVTAANKLVYSVHTFPKSVWGFMPDAGPVCVSYMMDAFGWIYRDAVAPLFIGDMGAGMAGTTDKAWAATLIQFLNGYQPGGITIAPGNKGPSTNWNAWGTYNPLGSGVLANGVMDSNGQVRQDQYAVYSQFFT